MSFPVNPTSGQIAVVNNIVYSYNSSGTGYWTRVAANTSTLAITVASLNIANTSSSTSTTTGALIVSGGVGIGGAVYIGTSSYIAGAQIITTATIGLYAAASSASTGTTSTFTILSTANSFSTTTGALQVRGGAGIGGNLYVGGALNVVGVSTLTGNLYTSIIYDIADTNYQTYLWPTDTSKIVGLSARGSEVGTGNDTQIGSISVTRGAITAANTATFYGLYNRSLSYAAGIGIDFNGNLWFGKVSGGGSASTRQSNLFYSDNSGNVYAGNSFRSNVFYANNTAYFLDFATTATKHTILSNAVSTDLIGYDPAIGVYIGGTDNRYLTNGTTSSGGPLWVMTGTTYNLIHSGNISQYAGASSTTTFTNPVIIRLNTVDTIGSTASTHLTLINPNTGAASSGIYWRFANQSEIRASLRVNDSGDIIHNSLSGNYRFQQDSGSSATNFLNSTTSFMSVDGAGNVSFPKNITAAKLIDYDDNTYYLDPNSTSTINQLTMKGLFTATVVGTANTWTDVVLATSNQGGTYITANRPTVATGDVGYKWSTGNSAIWTNYIPANDAYTLTWGLLGVKQFTMNSAGNMSTQVQGAAIGSPQFYDANNSSYYIKPSGYSYLNSLNLGGLITGISTGTGIRVFNNGSNSFTSTVFWGVPTLNYYWNWQTDAGGNAALWGYPFNNTSTRVLTVTPSGNWGFNQSTLPGDVDMIGGISVTGTGTTEVSVMKGSTSGFSLRVSDTVFGDFSLYDKAQGSWKLAINAARGSVGVNATANAAYGLNVGGDINIGGNIYQNGSALTNNVNTGTFSANQYAWYGTTGAGVSLTQNNTFETSAIFGADHVLGSGSLYDLLAWNPPNTTEYYNFNGFTFAWISDATDVKPLFNGQNSQISVSNNYTLTGATKQGVRFTWSTFSNRFWDALLITGNTAGVALDVTIESSNDGGTTIVTHVSRASIGSTAVNGMHYLRNQATNASTGQWFRLTIRETTAVTASVNLYNISLLGTKGAANRLLNWDNQRNITTYGNLTTNVVYDTNNTSYYLSPSKTSNLFTATLAGDLLTQGQGRFTGWQNNVATATRTAGLGVEVGVNAGAASISAYNRTSGLYDTLGIYGSPIKIIPQTTASVYIGGTWYDNDDPRYYVKPATGTVITNLKAFGLVQVVNTGGSSYNENIRLPRAADGIAMVSMATDLSGTGNILGQWNIVVQPTTGGVNQGQFSILNGSTASFSIATATSTATFAANVYAPKYLQVGADQTFFIQQGQTSYLNALQVGPIGGLFDVLTKGPLDDYANTFTYVHTSLGGIGDPLRDFNTATLSYASYSGSFYANANTPASTNNWYTLYQAAHRGGSAPNGPDYSSQIALPMTSADARDYTRMFFRVKNNTSWKSWAEVFTVGATNQSQGYTIYAQTLYDYADTRYSISPSGTSTLLNLKTYGSISGYLSGTPTAASSGVVGPPDTRVPALPRLGSAEWIFPSTTDANIGTSIGDSGLPAGNRTVYREGLYTWKSATSALGPTGSTTPYYAAVGFGAGSNGAAEIAAYLISGGAANDQAVGLHFRTLRDNGAAPWSKWTQILNSTTHVYAANLNQNLRTTDSPTFSSITLTNTPTFNQIKAGSYWITGGDNNQAKFIMPWNGNNQGGIGPYYAPANPPITTSPSDLQSFRFDEVSLSGTSPTYQSAYQGSTAVCIYLGAKKIFGSSGAAAWHDTVTGLNDSNFLLSLIASGVTRLGAAEFKNGITLTGDNITANQSGRLNLTPGRGIFDASYSFNKSTVNVSSFGTVATFGPGLFGWDGYVIGGNASAYDASFIKQSTGPEFALRGGGSHWAIYANGADAGGIRRISLNSDTGGLINGSYSVSVGGTLYCTQNIYAYSDRRKKTNIATIDNALGKVLQLRGVYYNRIDPEPEDIGRRDIGVIAQEVLEVLPEAVKHSEHTDEYSVNYGNMAGIFIEAIKDLKKELDELKAELNMLKGNK